MFRFLGNNPVLKTIFSQAFGLAAASIDGLVQNGPTGGSGAWLLAHPAMVPLYVTFASLAHNFLSKYAPPTVKPLDTHGGIAGSAP